MDEQCNLSRCSLFVSKDLAVDVEGASTYPVRVTDSAAPHSCKTGGREGFSLPQKCKQKCLVTQQILWMQALVLTCYVKCNVDT